MLTFFDLKQKQRNIRSSFSPDLGLRVHRCLSWLDRAEQAGEDQDATFIFLWISFNAAYADTIDACRSPKVIKYEDQTKTVANEKAVNGNKWLAVVRELIMYGVGGMTKPRTRRGPEQLKVS